MYLCSIHGLAYGRFASPSTCRGCSELWIAPRMPPELAPRGLSPEFYHLIAAVLYIVYIYISHECNIWTQLMSMLLYCMHTSDSPYQCFLYNLTILPLNYYAVFLVFTQLCTYLLYCVRIFIFTCRRINANPRYDIITETNKDKRATFLKSIIHGHVTPQMKGYNSS